MNRARLAATVATAAAFVPIVLTVLWWSQLPDPIASHWGSSGTPNGSAPRWLFAVLPLGIVAVGLGASLAAGKEGARHQLGVLTGASLVVSGVSVLGLTANLGAAHWSRADNVGLPIVLVLIGLGFGAGALLGRGATLQQRTPPAKLPSVGLAHGERAVFTASDRSGLLLAVGAAAGLGGLTLVAQGVLFAGAALSVAGVLSAGLSVIRLRVDSTAVVVRIGPGLPRVRIPLSDIIEANYQDIEPMSWGGWGYRGSLRLTGRAAIVLRRGEGLVLSLSGDRKFAVTIPGAAEAAGLVNDLLRQHRPVDRQ